MTTLPLIAAMMSQTLLANPIGLLAPAPARSTWRLAIALALAQALWMAAAFNVIGPRHADLLTGDVAYFLGHAKSALAGQVPYRDFSFEYPPGALLVMLPPAMLAGPTGDATTYLWAFVAQNILLAGVITVLLERWYGLRPAIAFNLLIAISAAYLPLRFDLLPALLTLLAVRWSIDQPARAGVALAFGVLVKLFPIVLLPTLLLFHLARRRGRPAVVLGVAFVATLSVTLLPIAIVTHNHQFDFLAFHRARGIQIESIAGGLLLLAGKLHLVAVREETSFFSSNLVCPWSSVVLKTLQPLMLATFGVQWIKLWRRWRLSAATERDLLIAAATTLGIFICCNRVFSPQYLVWVIPLLVAASVRLPIIATVCVITAIIFPFQYAQLKQSHSTAVLLLNVRNALVVAAVSYGVATRPRNRIAPVAL